MGVIAMVDWIEKILYNIITYKYAGAINISIDNDDSAILCDPDSTQQSWFSDKHFGSFLLFFVLFKLLFLTFYIL